MFLGITHLPVLAQPVFHTNAGVPPSVQKTSCSLGWNTTVVTIFIAFKFFSNVILEEYL